MFSKKNIQDILALTPMQEGLLFHYLKNQENNDYLNQLELTLIGEIQIENFKKAWQYIIDTNEMLRTIFLWNGVKNPVQIVKQKEVIDFTFIENITSNTEEIKNKDKEKGFDISKSCFRLTLIKVKKNRFKLLISNHHIIYDGWSNGIMIKAFFNAYSKLLKGYKLETSKSKVFKEYVKNKTGNLNVHNDYWKTYLKNYEVSTFINTSNTEESKVSSNTISFNISTDLVSGIEKYSKNKELSVASIFYGIWGVIIQKYSNSKDIIFGTAMSDRPKEIKGIENAIGLFIKTIPFRCKVSNNSTLNDVIIKANTDLIDLQEKGKGSLNDIVKIINNNQVRNRDGFETILTFENYPISTDVFSNEDIEIESFMSSERTHYPLEVMIEKNNGYKLTVTYNTNLFEKTFINSLLEHYQNSIKISVTTPETKISELEIMSNPEVKQLLGLLDFKDVSYPKGKTIHQLFEEKVVQFEQKIAIRYKDEEISYKTLNEKANQLARLLREQGVKNNDIVALFVGRSLDVVVGMLAILKSGGAYLPIDVEYPEERQDYLLNNSKAKFIVTSKGTPVNTSRNIKNIVIDYDEMASYNSENINNINQTSDLAYIIYTSGTTGNPKGVMISHNNVVRLLKNDEFQFSFSSEDIWSMFHSHCFDVSVWEIYGALLYGGQLIIVPIQQVKDTFQFFNFLKEERVTILSQTPSAFYNLIEVSNQKSDILIDLRYVICAGEALAPAKLEKWSIDHSGAKLINMYGTTETTVHATYKEILKEDIENGISIIGKPIPTLGIYILDKDLKLVPRGIPGELFIGGEGVSKGYLNNEELTRDRFIKNPYNPDEKLYKTGDWGRLLPNEEVEYLGRIDSQVKIRGYRIELGEIESQLMTHEGINEAIVRVKQNESDKFLVAYYISKEEINFEKLKDYLLDKLPQYMVPNHFIKIDKIPLTNNGKIDDNKLLMIKGVKLKKTIEPTKNKTQLFLLKSWNEVINKDNIDVNDNFFEIGGDSLNMIRLLGAINKALSIKITITDLFKYSSIKALASFIEERKEETTKEESIEPEQKTKRCCRF